ncbi:MAG: LPS biosynthesis glycosyltransferase [Pseudomonadota bacterium]
MSTAHADRVPTLREICLHAVIVAHREDTRQLQASLRAEGFAVTEVRGPYSEAELLYSADARCLVNHANAWRIAAALEQPTLIVEADFVPVRSMGALPAPVPAGNPAMSIGYLYGVGPQVWDLARSDLARGHAGGMVALLVPPRVASMLLDFFQEERIRNPTGVYSAFDTRVGYWLNARGVECFLPYRHYGEHGGIGNPEHALAGLGRPHQADCLHGSLAFLPPYAQGSQLRFLCVRLRARLWGVLRLVSGRLLAWRDLSRVHSLAILRFAAGRLVFRKPAPACQEH